MTRKELLEQVEDLTALLTAIDRLAPGYVDEEFFTYLSQLPKNPVSADLLITALELQKSATPPDVPARRRAG